MANSQLVTGQYVTLSQMPGSLADRVLGQLIDNIVLIAYAVVVTMLIMNTQINELGNNAFAAVIIALYLPLLLYHPLMELLHHGQSIGKTVMHTKVVNVDGTSPTLGGYLLRFILFPIDYALGLGLVSIILTQRAQRLGDLAAGTMVVKTKAAYIPLPDYSYTMDGYLPTYSEAAELTLNQAELIHRVLTYNKPDRYQLVDRLALKIQQTLGIVPQSGTQEQFLATMLNDYGYYCSTIEA